jgi:hypothetical protein
VRKGWIEKTGEDDDKCVNGSTFKEKRQEGLGKREHAQGEGERDR